MASKYDEKTKDEVVAFIRQYNQENGRGGQSAAVKKWNLNAVTVKSWLGKAGVETPGRGGKKKRGTGKARAVIGLSLQRSELHRRHSLPSTSSSGLDAMSEFSANPSAIFSAAW